MKTKYFLTAIAVFLSFIPQLPACILSSGSTPKDKDIYVKPITGTWINLAYKDVRNKYTNPKDFDNTDPEMWATKVRELSKVGIEYLVFMEVANEGKAFYPSEIMPVQYDRSRKSPVEAILDEADKLKMKVFLSSGWAKDQDDNLSDPFIINRQIAIMEEIAKLFKDHTSFYGWYLPVEDCLGPVLPERSVTLVNKLTEKARSLTPGKKILISPYGIGLADFDNPDFEKRLSELNVDIIAYQDEVGCVREKFPLPRLRENWLKMREIHNRLKIEMWANCETFTWEEGTNNRNSALIPAAYSRLLAQQAAATSGGVDNIISFMFDGILENPNSDYQLGQPMWSNQLYKDYMSWKNRDEKWSFLAASFMGRLTNSATPEMIKDKRLSRLTDGELGQETTEDDHWVKFDEGYNEISLDLQKPISLNKILIRTLNYHSADIGNPYKIYIYTSKDGDSYELASIKDCPNFPNDRHDAWIDGTLFCMKKSEVKSIKIAFFSPCKIYIDEIFVNPQ